MARPLRIEYGGAFPFPSFYHVIVRGNQRQNIFRGDRDRMTYLERLERYEKYRSHLYAYVLSRARVMYLLREWCGMTAKELVESVTTSSDDDQPAIRVVPG